MYLRRIESVPADVGDFDRSGLWINAGKEGYVVTSVAAGSPAAEAGVDVATSSSSSMAGRRKRRICPRLASCCERPPGWIIPMLVKGKAATRRVAVTLRDQI